MKRFKVIAVALAASAPLIAASGANASAANASLATCSAHYANTDAWIDCYGGTEPSFARIGVRLEPFRVCSAREMVFGTSRSARAGERGGFDRDRRRLGQRSSLLTWAAWPVTPGRPRGNVQPVPHRRHRRLQIHQGPRHAARPDIDRNGQGEPSCSPCPFAAGACHQRCRAVPRRPELGRVRPGSWLRAPSNGQQVAGRVRERMRQGLSRPGPAAGRRSGGVRQRHHAGRAGGSDRR